MIRLEHGYLTDAGYLCDGCVVREGHEHRCHRDDAAWADPRQVCRCVECRRIARVIAVRADGTETDLTSGRET